jgi:hypothetical protein
MHNLKMNALYCSSFLSASSLTRKHPTQSDQRSHIKPKQTTRYDVIDYHAHDGIVIVGVYVCVWFNALEHVPFTEVPTATQESNEIQIVITIVRIRWLRNIHIIGVRIDSRIRACSNYNARLLIMRTVWMAHWPTFHFVNSITRFT